MPATPQAPRAGVLTLSDAGSRGEREDTSGPAIYERLTATGVVVAQTAIIPDDPRTIETTLRAWVHDRLDLIVTTGGTGLGPRDHTPEATRRVIDREAPGIAELMRAAGLAHTPMAALSRGVVGVAARTLIVNLPGSEKGRTREPRRDRADPASRARTDRRSNRAHSPTKIASDTQIAAAPRPLGPVRA